MRRFIIRIRVTIGRIKWEWHVAVIVEQMYGIFWTLGLKICREEIRIGVLS